jgi:hypothetical protein
LYLIGREEACAEIVLREALAAGRLLLENAT